MKGKIVFVNKASRIAAAHIGGQKYIVFEYSKNDRFESGDELINFSDKFGLQACRKVSAEKKTKINVLSSAMSYAKAKLVVAPWQEDGVTETSASCM